ncbi:MAG: efflux RND transporter permease subunit [Ekhidna sp.]|nr:efflux RND transporter permease subunit [Ekhidna sp.]MBC6409257.1 efflux RND transporter permease subunit [Ekhidna sp.]
MKNLIEYFVKFPILANILIALTLIGGLVAMFSTQKSFFPTRSDRNITVSVSYPGASPEEMEEGVTLKVEEAINPIAGIDEIISTSSENVASITIVTLENFDIDDIYTEVKNAVDGINSFPANAEKPIVTKQKQRSTAQWLALTGDVDLKSLKIFAEDIEDELLAFDAISQVNVSGFPPLEISIEVSEQDLLRYNLTFDQVADAVRLNNRDISAGSVKSSSEEILIRSRAKETDAAKISDIVVRSNSDGSELLLKDVAIIKERFSDVPNKAMLDGKQAVFIEVRKLETEDLEKISKRVNNYVDEFNEKNNAVELHMTWDFMSMLNQRLDLLTRNGMVGLLLVLVSLGLFLSLRLSFWVAWGIPSSFLGMFILGAFVGLTINMISLFGMILVIGILVDDGIVIAENIYAHFEKHGNPIKAAVHGTIEVLPAVFTSVTTTIIAFTPLFLLTGGFEFLRDMAIVVCFSLGFSLLEAFFVLPAHLASRRVLKIKKENTRSHKIRSALNGVINHMKINIYGKALAFTMRYRVISVAGILAFMILIVGLLAGGQIRATFFPQIPFNSFNVNIAFKPGEREQKVEAYLKRFEKAIWSTNDKLKIELGTEDNIVNNTFSNIGYSQWESGSHVGNINIFYKELDDYGINQFDLINKIRDEIGPVAEAEKFSIGGGNRWGKPVSIRLLGKNYEELASAKNFLKKELANISGLKEIEDNVPIGRREILFDLRPEAYFLGLTHDEITKQMRQGFFGEEVQRFMKGNDELRVWVRYPDSGRKSISQLEDLKVKTTIGQEFSLTQLADYKIERGVSGIKHYNTSRAVTVEADMVDPFGEVPPILKKIREEIVPNLLAKYPSVTVDYGGQSQESAKAGQEIGLYFGGAFLLIFFIIMITFRSFYQAILIIMMIPLGWFGAILGHGIEDWISPAKELPVSLLSAWGMVALSGVIINDGVIFLAKFNNLVKTEKMTVYQAAYNAGLSRFRPIVLTSLTTVLGLYPLIKETSFQAQFLIPMAVSVAYGVLFGTAIILLFFPVFIIIFNDVRRYAKWLWTGKKPVREEVERVLIDQKRIEEYKESA